MQLNPLQKFTIISKLNGQVNAKIVGIKGDKYKVQTLGKHFQTLANKSRMFWINRSEIDSGKVIIVLH